MQNIEICNNIISIRVDFKQKNIVVFDTLILGQESITSNFCDLIDFIEYFNCYKNNLLNLNKTYYFLDSIKFDLQQNESSISLVMHLENESYAFSKLYASRIVHKLNRIIARCDLLHHN